MHRVLVANRGEIAVRVVRACADLGLESVVACSTVDRDSLAARLADRAVCIGPPQSARSYLHQPTLLATALGTGCDAVHPGYGFLAENAEFAAACEAEGLVFVGPTPDAIARMGDKLAAREVATQAGVPIVRGTGLLGSAGDAVLAADEIGYPVLLKAAAGGGGRGIRIVRDAATLPEAFRDAAAEAASAFGNGSMYLERFVERARHVEIQVLADGHGNAVALGERDCSLQRRYQKVWEEAPASAASDRARAAMADDAVRLAQKVGYRNAGTVEFVYDTETDEYSLLEMNTRIQVEHPVTEMTWGCDLVQAQLRIASGTRLDDLHLPSAPAGHAIECRITAEDPRHGFRPSPGMITRWDTPEGDGVRVDTHCFPGWLVSPFYDSLLAKLVVHGPDRQTALARTREALEDFHVEGVSTNLSFLRSLAAHPDVAAEKVTTRWLEAHVDELCPSGARAVDGGA